MATESKTPLKFWVVSALLLLWGLASTSIYVAYFMETPQEFALTAETTANRDVYANYIATIPGWAVAVGIIAAVTRLFGAVALLRRRACALRLYVLSLAFFAAALFRAFLLADAAAVMSAGHIATEGIFVGLNILAIGFAYRFKARGVLV